MMLAKAVLSSQLGNREIRLALLSGCTEQHISGDDIIPWLRSALGSYLFDEDDYPGPLETAGSALAYCASIRAQLASFTMAKSFLKLGDVTRAREYAQQAYDLRGEEVFKTFSSVDRDAWAWRCLRREVWSPATRQAESVST